MDEDYVEDFSNLISDIKDSTIIIPLKDSDRYFPEKILPYWHKTHFLEVIDPKQYSRVQQIYSNITLPIWLDVQIEGHIQGTNIFSKILTHVFFQTNIPTILLQI